jgi:rubrerythrin
MIDARTGQPEPCPMCGSADVRWRRRRWYDGARNGMRYSIEAVLSTVFRQRSVTGMRDVDVWQERNQALMDAHRIKAHDHALSSKTADRFWRCRACKREGHVFHDAVSMLKDHPEIGQ